MAEKHGPADASLWITRPLSYWEANLTKDLTHKCVIVLSTMVTAPFIDPVLLEEAYRGVVWNQPLFRADMILKEDGKPYFAPASDFSDLFEFVDNSGSDDGVEGYKCAWLMAEDLANEHPSFGSGKPLNKLYLVKRPDCYILLNQYNHSIGDGTTGIRLVAALLEQYDSILSGKGVERNPVTPLPSAQELSSVTQNKELMDEMIAAQIKRAHVQEVLLPLDGEEIKASQKNGWINNSMSAVGTQEGFIEMNALRKDWGVTIGEFSFAVMFMAEAAVHVRRYKGGVVPEGGCSTQYTDVVADLRSRLEPPQGDTLMMCIGQAEVAVQIKPTTTLYTLCQEVRDQMQLANKEKTLLLFAEFQERWKTSKETAELFASVPIERRCGFLPSNQMVYKWRTEFPWGKLETVHTLGSYWSPFFCNQVLLYQCVNGRMCYSVTHCVGENNTRDTGNVFQLFVKVMENVNKIGKGSTLTNFVAGF